MGGSPDEENVVEADCVEMTLYQYNRRVVVLHERPHHLQINTGIT